MAFGVADVELLPVLLPVAVYWIGSGIYSVLMTGPMEKNRLFTQEEEDSQNVVSRRQVVVRVLINQAMQMAILGAFTLLDRTGQKGDDHAAGAQPSLQSSLPRLVWQVTVALLFVDAWNYFIHRLMHTNKFLYKHVHAMHHLVIAPYAYGAQYVHPVESIMVDTLGAALAGLITGMSTRTSTILYAAVVIKGLDDHSGMWFPNNPLNRLLTNNSALHASHHQHHCIKHNYSTYFFTIWDRLLGTYKHFSVEVRPGGGYQLRTAGIKEQ